MENQLNEPEELDDNGLIDVDPIYNPLDEPVNVKPYSTPNVAASADDLTRPIAEPIFTPPPINPNAGTTTATGGDAPKPPKPEPVNPQLKHASKKENDIAAAQAARMIMHGYEGLHTVGNKALQVNEDKLNKMHGKGEINLHALVDYEYGQQIAAGDFFREYNRQTETFFTVSQEFKDEVTPILERVLSKRGAGLTDEQMLLFLFGQDIAGKIFMGIQHYKIKKSMIDSIRMATAGKQSHPAPPPPPPSSATASAEQEGVKEPIITPYNKPEEIVVVEENQSAVIMQRRGAGRPPTKK